MATPLTKPSDLTANNIKKAQVLATSELIEEEITLLIDKTVLTCFVNHCPYEIKTGDFYNVELTLNLADDYQTEKILPTDLLVERMGNSFSYMLYGTLVDGAFHTFTLLNDEGILYEHPNLNNSFIKLSVERIDAAFL
ncbi:hypothetical protein JWR97_15415 [Pseudomonas cedrina subsp. fulgida]|nr:hypothetical protein [Pseudomonas cedrina subsp. fulgida]